MSDVQISRDDRIVLEEKSHIYFIDGRCDFISVSDFKKQWFKNPYDAQKASESHVGKGVEHERSDMMPEEVNSMVNRENEDKRWRGTELHTWIEEFYKPNVEMKSTTNFDYLSVYLRMISAEGLTLDDLKCGDQGWCNFIKFVSANSTWQLLRSEWRIFHEKFKLAGTLDALFKIPMTDGTHRIAICDWKRVANLKFESKFVVGDARKFSVPIIFPATNYWEYHVQLNLYRIILEDYYDMKIDYMMIVRLSDRTKKFEIHLIERDDRFRIILESRTQYFITI